jgi:hypothetical protein
MLVDSVRWMVVKQLLTPRGHRHPALGIRSLTQAANVSIPTAANILSYPWHQMDPQVHGRVRPKTHSRDLQAKVAVVAGLYACSVVGVDLPSGVVCHLGGDGAVAVAR